VIYLDQAATSYPKPAAVIEAVCSALATAGNSGRGVHGMSLAASRLIYQARWELAEFFGASDPSQIAFSANATESLNMALLGLLEPGIMWSQLSWSITACSDPFIFCRKGAWK